MKKITVRQPGEQTRNQTVADAWVSGGADTQNNGNTERQKSTNMSGKQARLTIDLPQELHGMFKAACAKQRTKMKDEVLRFIEEWTQKQGNL
jgi:ParG